MNTVIVAAGQTMEIGCRVITWQDSNGFSFYPYRTFNARNMTLAELQTHISGFVLHHSVTYRAQHTYNALRARNLSVNFIMDDDEVDGYATIYQCLDIKDAGWSHGSFNSKAPGMEISYQPTAWTNPHLYNKEQREKWQVPEHPMLQDQVHGINRLVFAPTQAQINSCIALLTGFCRLFPTVQRKFPRDTAGKISKTVMSTPLGILNHYHLTRDKIDPSGLPLQAIEEGLMARLGVCVAHPHS